MLRPIEADGTCRYSTGRPGRENAPAVGASPTRPIRPGSAAAAIVATVSRRSQPPNLSLTYAIYRAPCRRRHALPQNLPCGRPYVDQDANVSGYAADRCHLRVPRVMRAKRRFVATFCGLTRLHTRRSPVAFRRRDRVGSPGVDRRDHAVPVLPPLANQRSQLVWSPTAALGHWAAIEVQIWIRYLGCR